MLRPLRTTWTMFGLVAAAVLVTYARVPHGELYHVSHDGIVPALSRVLVYSNFPVAIAAAVLIVVTLGMRERGPADLLGAVGIALCAVIVVPGVVDQGNLDAKPANALPALGVAIALVLSLGDADGRERLGRGRAAALAALALLAIPWLAAEAGVHFGAGVFLTDRPYRGEAAVHLGEHHGFDGALLAAAAILLWRTPSAMRRVRLRATARVLLGLLLAYGLVNAAQDFWLEQVVKRGWSVHEIPSALEPSLSPVWLVVLALAAAAVILGRWRTRPA